MAYRIPLVVVASAALLVSACAREPEPVTILPGMDKLGDPVCPAGTVLATDAESGTDVCMPATM